MIQLSQPLFVSPFFWLPLWYDRIFQTHLIYILHQTQNQHLSKELWLLFVANGISRPQPGCGVAVVLGRSLFLSLYSRQSWENFFFFFPSPSLPSSFQIYLSYIQTGTSDSILWLQFLLNLFYLTHTIQVSSFSYQESWFSMIPGMVEIEYSVIHLLYPMIRIWLSQNNETNAVTTNMIIKNSVRLLQYFFVCLVYLSWGAYILVAVL